MLFNETVSVFDMVDNSLVQYILTGVSWDKSVGITYNKNGDKNASEALVVIPFNVKSSDKFSSQKIWESSNKEFKMNHFTFREGQVVAKTDELVSAHSLSEILSKIDDSYTVVNISQYDRVIPHWELICK